MDVDLDWESYRPLKRHKPNEKSEAPVQKTKKCKDEKSLKKKKTSPQSKNLFQVKQEDDLVCPCCQVSFKRIPENRQQHVNECLDRSENSGETKVEANIVDEKNLTSSPESNTSNVHDTFDSHGMQVQKCQNISSSKPSELVSSLKENALLKRQTDIRKFFGGIFNTASQNNKTAVACTSLDASKTVGKAKWDVHWWKKPRKTETNDKEEMASANNQSNTLKQNWNNFKQADENYEGRKRICPFYKIITGSNFAVDAFSYGTVPRIEAYFLSHFHYDHYQGLSKKFKHPIYCSKVTSNLVKLQLGIEDAFLHPLPLYEPCVVNGVEVILLDANHCPGAVMFCFRFPNNRIVLHTGDFRADRSMERIPCLSTCSIDTVYLDTTYCDESYDFPSQEATIDAVVQLARNALKENKNTLFACGTYTIGKEKIFLAIAKAIGSKICAYYQKQRILRCLDDPSLSSNVTSNWKEAQVHILPMNKFNFKSLKEHLDKNTKYTSLVAIKPTGWEYKRGQSLETLQPKSCGSIKIYGVPYSEHSSYSELKRFVQFLKPARVLPTVNNGNARSRAAMESLFKEWLR